MSELHQYIPTTEYATTCTVKCWRGTHTEKLLDVKCHRVLLCGNQLTVKRARSARAQRNNSEDAKGRLEGFIPVAQDWHAGLCFLQVRISVLKSYMHHFLNTGCVEKALCRMRSR